jgi:putative transposase
MNRGAGRRIVFRDDRDRERFLELLAQMDERFATEIHAFCLMGNHYHAVVRSSDGRISEAMAWLGSRFTIEVNRKRDVDGAVFRGRFHSVLVERDSHLDWLFRYVNANPAELGWTQRFAAYPWSGMASTLGERNDQAWLRTDYYRDRFGEDRRRLEGFVEAARSPLPHSEVRRDCHSTDDVNSAVELARAPGPNVNSTAEVRAAQTLVALRCGIDESAVCGSLEGNSAKAFIRRMHTSLRSNSDLVRLVERSESVLNAGATERRSCA